jgi:predicted DNA-binding transcriptional regulator AlpA
MSGQNPSGEYLALPALSRLLKVSARTIYRWRRLGLFPPGHLFTPRCRRWAKAELNRWLLDRAFPPL